MSVIIIYITFKLELDIIDLIYKILYFEDRLIRLEKDRTDGYLADYKIMIAINLVHIYFRSRRTYSTFGVHSKNKQSATRYL